jgi:regulator of replication initiation timing
MISDFTSLLDKVRQLAELSQALRSENAALRGELATLSEENVRLSARMKEAHDRVAGLIDKLPAAAHDGESA